MNHTHFIRALTASEHAAVFEHAKRLSVELRRQAINDFWTALGRVLLSACVPSHWPTRRPPSCPQTTAPPSA
jgi:hypothetical protein